MKRRARRSFKEFLDQIRQTYPEASDPESLIRSGQVLVDGRIVRDPASLIRLGASIVVVDRYAATRVSLTWSPQTLAS
jgi:hypothetical protein